MYLSVTSFATKHLPLAKTSEKNIFPISEIFFKKYLTNVNFYANIILVLEFCRQRKPVLRCERTEFSVSRVKVPAVARRSLAYVGCDRRILAVIELFRSFPRCNEMVAFFAESVDGLFCHTIF